MKNIFLKFLKKSFFTNLCVGIVFLSLNACDKNDSTENISAGLPESSVGFSNITGDTLSYKVPVIKDSTIVMSFSTMAMEEFTGTHIVSVSVDTAKLNTYINKYGEALLLPPANYYLYETNAQLSPDSLTSTAVEINVTHGMTLANSTKYVLPVTIVTVDGSSTAVNTSQSTIYLVIRTGKSPYVGKANWSIVSYSSAYYYPILPNFSPYHLIDYDLNTMWGSNLGTPMPQYVEIDMAQPYLLNGIQYSTTQYIGTAGYPTEVNIQLSLDGQNWVDKGNYTDPTVVPGTTITLNFENSTARYIKFTVLNSLPYQISPSVPAYPWVIVAEISALQVTD